MMKEHLSLKKIPAYRNKALKWIKGAVNFAWEGVWNTNRRGVWISILKIANLSIRSFLDKSMQKRSMALTYSTVLTIVPAMALLFAIGRGFGFQNLLENAIYSYFPSQSKAIGTAIGFVDSYLREAKQGVFVGVGIILLLWTLISLLGNIEEAFNKIWDVKQNRSFYRKLTDYTSICLLVPVIMVCQSGVSIFMSSTIPSRFAFLTPMVSLVLDLTPLFLAIVAFTLSYMLIPNCKVQFKYALLAGAVCGIAFTLLQMLFVNGQIYVSKYNAIYGSFAFLPLLLVWLQLSWLILLFGCMLCYSAQNVLSFNYTDTQGYVSTQYIRSVSIVIMTIIMRRQMHGRQPLTDTQLAANYSIPVRMVSSICNKLHSAGMIYYVKEDKDAEGVAPAIDTSTFTLGEFLRRLDKEGKSDFIPGFEHHFSPLLKEVSDALQEPFKQADSVLMSQLTLPPSENRK